MRNDGVIEVKGKGPAKKKIAILLAIISFVFVALAVVAKLLPDNTETPAELSKDNEALQRTELAGAALTNKIKEIEDTSRREEDERLNEKRRLEEAAAAKRQAEQDAAAAASAASATASDTSEQIRQSQGGQEQAGSTPADGKDRPLPKHLRVLTGETLVALDNSSNQPEPEPATDSDKFLQGGTFADGTASTINNRKMLLSAGTALNCVLKTKIVTAYPGVTMCQLTKDVYSDNGETLLARAGALLIGEQKQAIAQGVARVFVTWTTIKDGNVNIRIDALGADGLGASGLPAWIDSHFWDRFGSAILLSFIEDALAASTSQISGSNNNSVSLDNTSDTGKQMAEIALENSINIPPTAYINQGEILTVIVPRNIDFSSVYEVH